MRIEGSLDRCDGVKLEGWLIDHDNPRKRFQLAVHCGTKSLGTYTADRFRQDLAEGGLAEGLCAFVIELPSELTESEIQALRIDVIGTEFFFPARIGRPVCGVTPNELYRAVATELHATGQHWRKFQTCILHIGTEKTGSTSLQHFIGMNRGVFADGGYFIPRSLAPKSSDETLKHSFLAALSMSDDKFTDDLRHLLHLQDLEALQQGRRDVLIRLGAEIATAPGNCRTVILSDEHCHSRLTSTEEVQNLKDFLDHFSESYRIIVYLRPQHELAISQYGMFVANGMYDIDMLPHFPPSPESKKQIYTNKAYFDYQALLERWAHVFGDQAIDARIYGANELRGGDIVSDFIYDLNVFSGKIELPPRLNSDLSARAQAFLTEIHRNLDSKRGPSADMLRERIRNAVRASFPGTGALPTKGEVSAFLQQYSESNELVRARWFPRRARLFNTDLDRYPNEPQEIAFECKEIINMFLEVLLVDQEMGFSLTPEALHRMNQGLPPSKIGIGPSLYR